MNPDANDPAGRPRASEARLAEIRREAEMRGAAQGSGVRPANAPLPKASPETGYYRLPALKAPQWTWEIPAYFFAGGAAGAAAVIGAVGNLTGADRRLIRDARWLAAIGGAISPALLISDLGTPSRFLNMLRVFKIQSPMSVGSWTLVAFSNSAAMSAVADAIARKTGRRGLVRFVANASEVIAAFSGLALTTYTGVLIGATAIPVWAEHVGTLPIHFAASGTGAAVSILELRGHDSNRALNAMAIAAAVAETVVGARIELDQKRVNKPLKEGATGALIRLGGLLSGPLPLALRLLSLGASRPNSRKLRRAAAASTIAGSMITRQAWIKVGKVSAQDSKVALSLPEKS